MGKNSQHGKTFAQRADQTHSVFPQRSSSNLRSAAENAAKIQSFAFEQTSPASEPEPCERPPTQAPLGQELSHTPQQFVPGTEVSARRPHDPLPLTAREACVARLISLGCTVAEAGAILFRSPNTVDNHKSNAMKKLGTHNLAELTRRVIQLGISPLDDELSAEELAGKQRAASKSEPRKPR